MFKILLLCSLTSLVYGSVVDLTNNKIEKNIEDHVLPEGNIEKLLKTKPTMKLISSTKMNGSTRNIIRYTFGNRVIDDRIVEMDRGGESWGLPQTIDFPVKYNGVWGQYVTFVEIQIDQTSGFGNASIFSGGIGQSSISISVKASFTTYFYYEYQILAKTWV